MFDQQFIPEYLLFFLKFIRLEFLAALMNENQL